MTFDELKQQLIEAGFQWTDPAAPAPEPDPKPDANAQLIAAITDLKAAIQASAVKQFNFDQPPKEQTAEDILGAMLAGAKPDNK